MSKFKSFFKEKAKKIEPVKVKLDRFDEEFVLQPLTPNQQEKIMDASKKSKPGMKGRTEQVVSEGKFTKLRVIEAMIVPDLNDTELQESYGVMGAEDLLNAMLTADEVTDLLTAVIDEESETVNDLVEKAKN
jgi:Phage XkdN-like protein.